MHQLLYYFKFINYNIINIVDGVSYLLVIIRSWLRRQIKCGGGSPFIPFNSWIMLNINKIENSRKMEDFDPQQ